MLSLNIEGSWEPEDFIEVLKGVESLYYKAAFLHPLIHEPPYFWFRRFDVASSFDKNIDYANDWLLDRARSVAPPNIRLRIARIQYASPGSIDLAGLGKAAEAVKGIVDSLITFFTERELRRQRDNQAKIDTGIKEVELEKEHESLRSLKIANARAFLKLRRDYPDMPEELLISLIVRDQDRLIPTISERKLVAAQRFDGERPQGDKRN